MKFQLAAITLKKDETYVAGAGTTDTSTSKKAIFYHADRWKLEGQTLPDCANVLARLCLFL